MTFTQADLDAIDRAILDNGDVLEVQFSDRLVRFKTFDDMLKRRAFIASHVVSTGRTRLAATSKGTGSGGSDSQRWAR